MSKINVSRKNALELLLALGFSSAKKWDNKRITKKLAKIETFVDDDTTTDSNTLDLLLDSIIEAKGAVKITDEETADTADEKPAEKKGKTVKKDKTKSKKDKKSKAGKKDKADKKDSKSTSKSKKTADKSKTTTKKDKAKKAKATPAKAKAERDRFGAKLETITARFNAAVSKKGKTLQELMKEADISRNYKDHVTKLVDRGFVVKKGEKYSVASKK